MNPAASRIKNKTILKAVVLPLLAILLLAFTIFSSGCSGYSTSSSNSYLSESSESSYYLSKSSSSRYSTSSSSKSSKNKKTRIACHGSVTIKQYATNDPWAEGYWMECLTCHGKGWYYNWLYRLLIRNILKIQGGLTMTNANTSKPKKELFLKFTLIITLAVMLSVFVMSSSGCIGCSSSNSSGKSYTDAEY